MDLLSVVYYTSYFYKFREFLIYLWSELCQFEMNQFHYGTIGNCR